MLAGEYDGVGGEEAAELLADGRASWGGLGKYAGGKIGGRDGKRWEATRSVRGLGAGLAWAWPITHPSLGPVPVQSLTNPSVFRTPSATNNTCPSHAARTAGVPVCNRRRGGVAQPDAERNHDRRNGSRAANHRHERRITALTDNPDAHPGHSSAGGESPPRASRASVTSGFRSPPGPRRGTVAALLPGPPASSCRDGMPA